MVGVNVNELHCDVLIVGGGLAGCVAALRAAATGARVVVMEKSHLYRSGSTGAGIDHFLAHLNTGPDWDTDDEITRYLSEEISEGLVPQELIRHVYTNNIEKVLALFKELDILQPNAEFPDGYFRTPSYGARGPYLINFNGRDLKVKLGTAVRRALRDTGGAILNKTVATRLLSQAGRVIGAVGFGVQTGDCTVVYARSIVISTNGAVRMFENPSGFAFNTWNCPYTTGDGWAMAFNAGAKLVNLELTTLSITAKNFSSPGLAGFVGMGCYMINRHGERFLFRYHPQGEKGPRELMAAAIYREVAEGRGPCFIDARHLDKEKQRILREELLAVDKCTFEDYLAQNNIDLATDLLEIQVSELQATQRLGQGLYTDWHGATNLPGLFAAGDCSWLGWSASLCATSGWVTGEAAGKEALSVAPPVPDAETKEQAAREYARVTRPFQVLQAGSITYRQFEDQLRQIMSDGCGYERSEQSLKTALHKLDDLAEQLDYMKAENLHDLLRINEARNLWTISKIIAAGALRRQEPRFGLGHNRVDHIGNGFSPYNVIAYRDEDGSITTIAEPVHNFAKP